MITNINEILKKYFNIDSLEFEWKNIKGLPEKDNEALSELIKKFGTIIFSERDENEVGYWRYIRLNFFYDDFWIPGERYCGRYIEIDKPKKGLSQIRTSEILGKNYTEVTLKLLYLIFWNNEFPEGLYLNDEYSVLKEEIKKNFIR
jgi:hypothetical protein